MNFEMTVVKAFDHLEARWQDEKGYEDFSDYTTSFTKTVETAGGKVHWLKSDPFYARVEHSGILYDLTVVNNKINVQKWEVK